MFELCVNYAIHSAIKLVVDVGEITLGFACSLSSVL